MTRLYTLVLMLISIIGGSYAATIEVTPYVNAGISYQDNLFLTANEEEAISVLDTTKQSDSILEISPGIRAQLDHLRQQFFLDISVLHREFDRFDSLNFDGGDAKLQWDWLYGSNWDGLASYRFANIQSGFSEQLGRQGDESDIDKFTISANRLLTPRYTFLSGLSYKSNDYKRRTTISRDDRQFELGIRYTSLADNTIDIVLENTQGEYPNRNQNEIARGLDDGFTENRLLTRVNWQPTHKSKFILDLGYLDREQDNISADDFNGLVGEINYHWALSAKTKIKSAVWHDLLDSEDQIANFSEATGASVELDWKVTPKIEFVTKLSYEERDYQSNSRRLNVTNRDEESLYGSAAVSYKIRRNITVITDYLYEKRDSNQPLREYKNNVIGLSVKLDF